MKKNLFIITFIFSMSCVFAQTAENKEKIIPKDSTYKKIDEEAEFPGWYKCFQKHPYKKYKHK